MVLLAIGRISELITVFMNQEVYLVYVIFNSSDKLI